MLEVTRTSFDTSAEAATEAELDAAEAEVGTADDTIRNLVLVAAVLLVAVAALVAYLRGRRMAHQWELEAVAAAQALPAGEPAMAFTQEVELADVVEIESVEPGNDLVVAPPVPVVGYGSLEQTFWDLGKSIGLGALSVDDAVTQFFAEADAILG